MKGCALYAVNDLRCEEREEQELLKGQVRLHIKAAGICGSDIQRVFEKGTYHFPTIPGHEFAGEIVAAADEENKVLIGRKATVFPLLPCFKCSACQIGEYAQCEDYDYYGSRRDGGFAEYLNVNVWNLVLVPDNVSFEEAAMCEPCAVAIHALSQVGVEYGDTVAISGAGTIGIMLAMVAESWGAGKVILMDVDGQKLDFARKLGFSNVINTLTSDVAAEINAMTANRGANVVVEGAGVSGSLENCLKAAANFGRVVLMGNPIKEITVPQKAYWAILRKQLTCKGTWNSGFNNTKNDWEKAITALSGNRLKLKPLITHRFSFEQCNEAFRLLRERKEFAVKVMFINE